MNIFHNALNTLRPNANWVIIGDDAYANINWVDEEQTKPTESEVDTKVAELQAVYDAQAYARSRKPEYPQIGDQLDSLFHAGVFPDDMTAILQAVKDKYPK